MNKARVWLYAPFWAQKFNPNHDETGKFTTSDSGTELASQALSDHIQAHKDLKEHNAKTGEIKAGLEKAKQFWKDVGLMKPIDKDQEEMRQREAKAKELEDKYNKTREALKPHADVLKGLAENLRKK